MAITQQRVTFLLQAWASGRATPAEEAELMDWLADQHDPSWTQAHLESLVAAYDPQEAIPAADWEGMYRRIQEQAGVGPAPVIRPLRWWRWAAAAILVLAIAAGTWYLLVPTGSTVPTGPQTVVDVAPGRQGAILKLGDGSTVVVDSVGNGQLAAQGKTAINIRDGKLYYEDKDARQQQGEAMIYNTMTTPRGRHYQLYLPDGTAVWLNAASSITYPVAFRGRERKVTVHGEVYFEVAKDAQHPFVVDVDGRQSVTVLGTHFNVKAYADDPGISTTLLEGKVQVAAPGSTALLAPGQQAIYTTDHADIRVDRQPDLEAVMAWKNGLFKFERASLEEVLRQFARWYDVEVDYPEGIPALHFAGEMGRDLSLTQALRGLQKMGLHYRIEGQRLIILNQ